MKLFFSIHYTPDEFKVRLAIVHFEGKALQWHNAYIKSVGLENLTSWNEYQILLHNRVEGAHMRLKRLFCDSMRDLYCCWDAMNNMLAL